MSQIGRSTKNLEAPRPLKSANQSRLSHSSSVELRTIEELITLIENVAESVAMGQCNPDSMSLLLASLKHHGPQLEEYSKSTLDQAYVKFRNASQDERLSIITRMNLLELIELRARSWQVADGLNTYYKHKVSDMQPEPINMPSALQDLSQLDTSPSGVTAANLLNPGEVIRTSGKFAKPTKIPGKNYTKDEVVIRNADSGKVMGIKGRRVHMIEELSETIISFQRVNPGAKERLVQITGPSDEKINFAKQLIEDTIRRNASPMRSDDTLCAGGGGVAGAGSCSSLTSSNSDDQLKAMRNVTTSTSISHVSKSRSASGPSALLHSLSSNDTSLGEYKFTVNVGQHSIKITGDNIELVRASKLILDEYFASSEFLTSGEAGAEFGLSASASSASIPLAHKLDSTSPLVDSGVELNVLSQYGGMANQSSVDVDDVFFDDSVRIQRNGLTRSRRSHFSHGDTSMDASKDASNKSQQPEVRISYEKERLLHFAKSIFAWELPREWTTICELYPNIVRNKPNVLLEGKIDGFKFGYDLMTGCLSDIHSPSQLGRNPKA